MSNIVDALVYSQIKNNVTENTPGMVMKSDDWNNFTSNILDIDSDKDIQSEMNNILSQTTIKRACCLNNVDSAGNLKVDVQIPIPKDINNNTAINNSYLGRINGTYASTWGTYGYIDKPIIVPKSMCPSNFGQTTDNCDKFYELYCKNAKAFFINEGEEAARDKKTTFTYTDESFFNYKPECGCYPDMSKTPIVGTFSPSCFSTKCSHTKLPGVYTPKSVTNCTLVDCRQAVQIDSAVAINGGKIDVTLENKCSAELAAARNKSPPSSNPPSSNIP
jgi:hypothetical protein